MAIYAYGEFTPNIAKNAWIFPSADIIGNVTIGESVYIGAGVVIRGDYGEIVVEEGAAIEEHVTIHAPVNKRCHIQKNAIIGHAAMLHGCIIEEEAVIGMSSVVTNEAKIGRRSIIAEGAVVTTGTVIPSNMIAVGIPAKILKPVPRHIQKFWLEAGKIYRQLAYDYPQKLKRI